MIQPTDQDLPGEFVWQLFVQLRNRRLPLGIEDYEALKIAVREGFGTTSRDALRDLCCALWAKSRTETEVVGVLFDSLKLPEWHTSDVITAAPSPPVDHPHTPTRLVDANQTVAPPPREVSTPLLREVSRLPPLNVRGLRWSDRPFVFVPQYPVTYREAAQAWRRLRRPVRFGPPTEFDTAATIDARARQGIVAPPVLVPPRRNVARLILLLDRQGSMTPFHGFVDEMCAAIRSASLQRVEIRYFRNLPSRVADANLLDAIDGTLFPTLDSILGQIEPAPLGEVARDSTLLDFEPLRDVLADLGPYASAVMVSDAGAARGVYRADRLLQSAAFIKALRLWTPRVVWLNPVAEEQWKQTTAGELARHVPLFPMTRRGMHAAIGILQGHPAKLESPL